jgi:hypothetical protein
MFTINNTHKVSIGRGKAMIPHKSQLVAITADQYGEMQYPTMEQVGNLDQIV